MPFWLSELPVALDKKTLAATKKARVYKKLRLVKGFITVATIRHNILVHTYKASNSTDLSVICTETSSKLLTTKIAQKLRSECFFLFLFFNSWMH